MSRPSQNHLEVSQQTGFQSACAEYAEKRLSMSEHFETLNPAVIQVVMTKDKPELGFRKDDLLHVRMDLKPKDGNHVLAILNDEMYVFKYHHSVMGMMKYFGEEQLDDTRFGVIILQSRDRLNSNMN